MIYIINNFLTIFVDLINKHSIFFINNTTVSMLITLKQLPIRFMYFYLKRLGGFTASKKIHLFAVLIIDSASVQISYLQVTHPKAL